MKILFVGGNFDDNGGRQSSLVSQFAYYLTSTNTQVTIVNGGFSKTFRHY